MRAHATKVDHDMEVMEIVGTGGDRAHSFNISTTAALVLAAAGIPIAKHGNRAASSQCGAADCLEALGVNINLTPERCTALLKEGGHLLPLRPEVPYFHEICGGHPQGAGDPTVFNILGPLTNPAVPAMQLLGATMSLWFSPWLRCWRDWGSGGAWWSTARISWMKSA